MSHIKMSEAMILAAGEGRRLLPITNFIPKSLLPIANRPLLENIIISLKKKDITKICINVHHLKEKVIGFLKKNDFGIEIEISIEEKILGIGGGIGMMRKYINAEDFLVHNGDIITNIQIGEAYKFHEKNDATATLLIRKSSNSRDILLAPNGTIVDIAERLGIEGRATYRFTGIAILNRKIFDYLPENEFYSIIDAYIELIKEKQNIFGFICKDNYWFDIGTKENYLWVHKDILVDKKDILYDFPLPETPFLIGNNSELKESAKLSGFTSIGENCFIGAKVKLENCIFFDNTAIDDGKRYKDCIMSNDFKTCLHSNES